MPQICFVVGSYVGFAPSKLGDLRVGDCVGVPRRPCPDSANERGCDTMVHYETEARRVRIMKPCHRGSK